MKKAAFFDVDGTLVACQSQKKFSDFLFSEKILGVFHILVISCWFAGYRLGLLRSSIGMRRVFYRFLSFDSAERVNNLMIKAYQDLIRPALNLFLKERILGLKKQGYLIVLLSGTLQQFCNLIADEFGADQAFGTRLIVEDGHFRGKWEGDILEGEAKARFVKKYSKANDISLEQSIAYSDSSADLPLLEICGSSVAVNPDPALKTIAQSRSWEILNG
ncbi:MAG: Phosphoserine phosphatase [Candidatus Omnitrophica bacterium ADurb.Bin277]|nr:MAG: Phosphoserine phosphatase [Candidatus Omnitrophica bacterium ADurb.Bin277]